MLEPKPAINSGGLQTMQSGNSGIGSGLGIHNPI
jgi:hypothetical protein